MDPVETIEIQNVVGSAQLAQELELASLAADLPGARYDSETFPGLIYRLEEPQATVLLFRSGSLICTGAASPAALETAIKQTLTVLADLGIEVPAAPSVTVENVVCGASLGQRLNLSALAVGLGLEDIEYEPEQFPGLVYRPAGLDVVVLLFGSGSMVITGATARAEAVEAVDHVVSRLDDLGLVDL